MQEFLFFQPHHSTFLGVCYDKMESSGPHPTLSLRHAARSRIFATFLVKMPAGEGIGTAKNRSNVEKHSFDLFFAIPLKMSKLLSEDQFPPLDLFNNL
jgi:hypothetical protein